MNNLIIKTEKTLEKYNADIEHAKEVANYSKMIFEALKNAFESYSEKEEEYLILASLLHDIGYFVEKKSHHKHTLKLILDDGIENYTKEEVLIIANIARYHRQSIPNTDTHEMYKILPVEKQHIVKKLSSILRLADGLDKPHKNLILRIRCEHKEEEIVFYIKSIGFKPNLKAAQNKKDLMEITYNKKVSFIIE